MRKAKSQPSIKDRLVIAIGDLSIKRVTVAGLVGKRIRTEIRRHRLERKMVQREAEVILAVASEKDENGKAAFPNESTRKAEVTNRLAKDDEFDTWIRSTDTRRTTVANTQEGEYILKAEAEQMDWQVRMLFGEYSQELSNGTK